MVAYYPYWAASDQYTPSMLPTDKLTHVIYAFDYPDPNTGQAWLGQYPEDVQLLPDGSMGDPAQLHGLLQQLVHVKRMNPHVKVSMSVGGATFSGGFSTILANSTKRQTLVQYMTTWVNYFGLDGVDVDWEYPTTASDGIYFVTFVKELRASLDKLAQENAASTGYLLTVALGGDTSKWVMDLPSMISYIDYVHLMAYDYAQGASLPGMVTTGYLAPLHCTQDTPQGCVESSVNNLIQAGVPAQKLVVGLPAYGRTYTNISQIQPNMPMFTNETQSGSIDLYNLPDFSTTAWMVKTDRVAQASWAYNAQVKEWIAFDTAAVTQAKAAWVAQQGLGGMMVWHSAGDRRPGQTEASVVESAWTGLGGATNSWELSLAHTHYPTSPFTNIQQWTV